MKNLLLLSVFIIFSYDIFCQNINGHYEGAISRDGSIELVDFNFGEMDGKSFATYSIPDIGFYDVPVEKLSWSKDTLLLKFYYDFNCFLNKDNGDITGTSVKWNPKLRMHVKKTKIKREKNFDEEEIGFNNGIIKLAGVIFKPKNIGNVPYVILIHGSGSQDRDTPYYHSLGYFLANNGIGVLLYDKRGCGKSTGSFQTATFYDLADDAGAALKFLRVRNKSLHIGFLGTSQGGWIAPIAANKYKNCSFVILNVGPSVSLFKQDIDRIKYTMIEDGNSKNKIDSALEYTRIYFNYVKNNTDYDKKLLQQQIPLAKKSTWADYINIPSSENDMDIHWWRTNDYDPAQNLKSLHCPVLSLFGEKDILVPPAENEKRMDSLLSLAKIKYQIEILPGCGHDMLTFQGLNGSDWNWPKVYWQWRKRPPEFYSTIINWIRLSNKIKD